MAKAGHVQLHSMCSIGHIDILSDGTISHQCPYKRDPYEQHVNSPEAIISCELYMDHRACYTFLIVKEED